MRIQVHRHVDPQCDERESVLEIVDVRVSTIRGACHRRHHCLPHNGHVIRETHGGSDHAAWSKSRVSRAWRPGAGTLTSMHLVLFLNGMFQLQETAPNLGCTRFLSQQRTVTWWVDCANARRYTACMCRVGVIVETVW